MKIGLEGLLRPPVELYSAFVAFGVAAIVFLEPRYFLLTDFAANSFITLAIGLGIIRMYQGYRIIAYHKILKCLKEYKMSSNEIPTSRKQLFIGRGFRWTALHTQRLRDVKQYPQLLEDNALWAWVRQCSIRWSDGKNSLCRAISNILDSNSRLNPFRPLPDVGGNPALHGVGACDGEEDIHLSLKERNGHILVFGKTRVGKTRLAEILITQDIRRGDVVIVLDPKGDQELMRRVYEESVKANRKCHVFHLAHPDISVAYNPIGSFSRITEIATRMTDPLPEGGNSAAFKQFAWRYVNIIANAMVALNEKPTMDHIRRYISDMEPLFIRYGKYLAKKNGLSWPELVERYKNESSLRSKEPRQGATLILKEYLRDLEDKDNGDPTMEGLLTAVEYSREYFNKLVASLGPLLEKMMTGRSHELLVPSAYPNSSRMVIDWRRVIESNEVVYVGLDALSDSEVASAVGAAMFADLTSVAGEIYNTKMQSSAKEYRPISIHADEINELMESQFLPLINKGGGAGFQITGYTQTLADLSAKLGSHDKASQAIGNFSTLIMFQVRGEDTANLIVEQLPHVEIQNLVTVSGATDDSNPDTDVDFRSTVQTRMVSRAETQLSVNDLIELPKGQCFCLMHGGKLFKLRVPLPVPSDDKVFGEEMYSMVRRDTFGVAA